jgi:hypothetical protein
MNMGLGNIAHGAGQHSNMGLSNVTVLIYLYLGSPLLEETVYEKGERQWLLNMTSTN